MTTADYDPEATTRNIPHATEKYPGEWSEAAHATRMLCAQNLTGPPYNLPKNRAMDVAFHRSELTKEEIARAEGNRLLGMMRRTLDGQRGADPLTQQENQERLNEIDLREREMAAEQEQAEVRAWLRTHRVVHQGPS